MKPWAVAFWLAVWQIASMLLNREILLVSPLRVLLRLGELALTSLFWKSIAFSFSRIACGFFLAVLTGCILAALSAGFLWIGELVAPLLLTIKTIPVASFIILALIWFSSKNLSVLISFLMVLPVIYNNVLAGIRAENQKLLEMAEIFEIPVFRRLRYIDIPQILPYFCSGCEVGLGLCWKSGIAAEVIGMPRGSVGERLQQAKIYLDTPDLFAWTLVIVLLSLTFERLVLALLKKSMVLLKRM